MKKLSFILFLFAALTLCTAPILAQRISPHETISVVTEGNRVTVTYGRPYSKDPRSEEIRKIWGTLVPYGKVWRTGADEATLLITQKPIVLGDFILPAGAYTLFTQPEEDGSAVLIINKQIGQWGLQYDAKQDLARVALKKESVPQSVDQFTMALAKNPAGGGFLKMTWETTSYSVPFTVKK